MYQLCNGRFLIPRSEHDTTAQYACSPRNAPLPLRHLIIPRAHLRPAARPLAHIARYFLSRHNLPRPLWAQHEQQVVIRVLARYGLEGEREAEHTGVWVGGAKVAAIGLNASRWVTSHGFALNVNPDLRAFEAIVPCGIEGRPVTRLCDLVGDDLDSRPSLDTFDEDGMAGGTRGPVCTNSETAAVKEVNMEFVRSLVTKEFEGIFGLEIEVVEVHAAAHGGDTWEREILPTECEPGLLARLRVDSLRQLELKRQGR